MSKARKVKGRGGARKPASKPKAAPKAKPKVHKFAGKKPSARLVSSPRKPPEGKAAPHEAPHIHKYAKAKAAAPAAVDEDEIPSAKDPLPVPQAMAARLAAMAAAAAGDNEPEIAARKPAPSQGPVEWEDGDEIDDDSAKAPVKHAPRGTRIDVPDDGPTVIHSTPSPAAPVADGVEVVAKGPSKFSQADLELLRASIKVKGSSNIVEGVNFDELKWDSEGLLPVVAQDRRTGAVLSLAWTNKETLETTIKSKQMTYWNRALGKIQQKGEGSGHPQRLVKLAVDCDKDSILATVDQEGPACHRDTGTCWTNERALPLATFLGELDHIIAEHGRNPKPDSQTSRLLKEPLEGLKQLVEEVNQTLRVLQGKPHSESLEHEVAELLYHLLVSCRTKGVGLDKVLTELYSRHLAAQLDKK